MPSYATVLAQLAAERHWTAKDAVGRYAQAADDLGEDSTLSTRQWSRWCAGELKQLPLAASCRIVERMFGRPAAVLFAAPGTSRGESARVGADADVAAAAEDAARLLSQVESAMLGPATLEQIAEDVIALARRYTVLAPTQVIASALQLQCRVQDLLVRTARPGQQADLYLVLGELSGLMAVASFDLGEVSAASSLARTAWGYGEHIDHDGLRAWSRGTQALLAYWAGRSGDAVRLAASAHRYQPHGTALIRACMIEARAHAHHGDRASALRALQRANAAYPSDAYDELHDGVGGEFAYSQARAARCEGSVWVQLGDGPQAIAATRRAIGLFAAAPNAKVAPQAHADLAAGHLLCGDLRAATDHLATVFDVPSSRRVTGLNERMRTVATILTGDALRHQPAVRELRGAIGEFLRQPAGKALATAPVRRAITAG